MQIKSSPMPGILRLSKAILNLHCLKGKELYLSVCMRDFIRIMNVMHTLFTTSNSICNSLGVIRGSK